MEEEISMGYKSIGYKCEKCGHKPTILMSNDEEQKDELEESCEKCGGKMKKFNIKDNAQVWKYFS